MAKIATYTAPVERIRPSDLGYTSQIQLGRRLSGFAQETLQSLRADTELEASALKQGGALESQNILTQRRGAVALMKFLESQDVAPAARGGGRGLTGTMGNQGAGTAGPREVARAAPALIQAVTPPAAANPAAPTPIMRHWWDTNPYPTPRGGNQPVVFGAEGLGGPDPYGLNKPNWSNGDPLGIQGGGEPQPASGGNMQKYGYGTGGETMGDTYGPPAPEPASPNVFASWYNWATGGVGSIFSGAGSVGGSTDTQENLDAFISDAP